MNGDNNRALRAYELIKNHEPLWQSALLDNRELLVKVEDNKSLMRLAIDNGLDININMFEASHLVNEIDDIKVILYLFEKYNSNYILGNINEIIAQYRFPSGKTFFELLLKNNVYLNIELSNNKELIDIAIKYNDKNVLSHIKEDDLFKIIEGNKTVIEYIIEQSNIIDFRTVITKEENLIKLKELGLLNKIKFYVNDDFLLSKCNILANDGSLIIEYLIDNDVNFKINEGDYEVMKIIFDKGYFKDFPYSLYLKDIIKMDKLDELLLGVKSGKILFNLSYLRLSDVSLDDLADYYLKLAEYNMLPYIDRLSVDDLLQSKDNEILLIVLLNKNKDLTLNSIIDRIIYDSRIVTVLMSVGIDVDEIDIVKGHDDIPYKKDKLDLFLLGPLRPEDEMLLKQLEEVFMNDGKSDPELIDVLIQSYRNALINYRDITILEIKKLIELKEKNNYIIYVKDNVDYYAGGEVHSELTTSCVAHETGHLLHNLITHTLTADGFLELRDRLQNDDATKERLIEFHNKFKALWERLKEEAKAIVDSQEVLQKDNIDEVLSLEMETKKEALIGLINDLGIDEETLDILLKRIYTKERYNKNQQDNAIRDITLEHFDSYYSIYGIISDIFDSIYRGKYTGNQLVDNESNPIKGMAGHGIPYYFDTDGYDEIMANLSSLMKLPNGLEAMELLHYYLGDELYNLIFNFYVDKIVKGDIAIENDLSNDIEENKRRV